MPTQPHWIITHQGCPAAPSIRTVIADTNGPSTAYVLLGSGLPAAVRVELAGQIAQWLAARGQS